MFGTYGSPALNYAKRFSEICADTAWFHSFDPWAFEECAKHNLNACVEFPVFRTDYEKRPHLKPIGIDGKPIRHGVHLQGVCLSDKEFLAEVEENLVNGLKAHNPAGVWLDYLTYGGWFEDLTPDLQNSCFCKDCIKEFNSATGCEQTAPLKILEHHKADWTAHKCKRIADFAKIYSEIIRKIRPDATIGIYMCPFTPDEYNGALSEIFAQDYELLAPYVDVFTPLIYCKKSGRGDAWGREFLEKSPNFIPEGKEISLILDAMDFPNSMEEAAKSGIKSCGLQMFSGAEIFEKQENIELFAKLSRDFI